jgi:hypothetical protein
MFHEAMSPPPDRFFGGLAFGYISTMTDNLEEILERFHELEEETARAVEQRLAASHRRIVHELRRDWLTTVLKSIFAAIIASAIATAIIGPRSLSAENEK